MRLVPLPEGRGVDLDDRALDERVGPDELVVRGVVLDAYDTRLLRAVLRAPSKVARVEPKSAVLEVATADTNGVDALGTNLGAGSCERAETRMSATERVRSRPKCRRAHPAVRARTFSSCGRRHASRPKPNACGESLVKFPSEKRNGVEVSRQGSGRAARVEKPRAGCLRSTPGCRSPELTGPSRRRVSSQQSSSSCSSPSQPGRAERSSSSCSSELLASQGQGMGTLARARAKVP